jgi:deoxyribose-phosphate aldolase
MGKIRCAGHGNNCPLTGCQRPTSALRASLRNRLDFESMTLSAPAATADALDEATSSPQSLRRFLHGLPGVDQVGAEARTAALSTRSIKTTAKAWALDLAISMIDLTTLEGQDTVGKVRALSAKAVRPDPADPTCPSVAAVCVYPDLVRTAKAVVGSSGIQVASVATSFPSGRAALDVKLQDTRDAVAAGADEIDMVIDRGAFLSGDYSLVFDEIVAVKETCARGADGPAAHLKVILETGELATYDNVRRASWLAMLAGADFIKSSTGKIQPAATMPVTLVMLEAVRDFRDATGRQIGVKPAGGISNAKDAIRYLVMVNETAGDDWLSPDWFRFGASRLLNDLLMQRTRLTTGRYSGPDYFTLD